MSQETELAEQVAAKIAEKATEAPAEQPAPKPKAKKAEPTPEPAPEPKAAPKVDPDAPVKVRVLRNFFYDGRRFRTQGEVITLTPRQVINAGDAVERV